MTDLAKLVVRLEAQSQQYTREIQKVQAQVAGLKRATDTQLRAMDARWRGFSSGVRRAILALGIGALLRGVVKETAEAQKSLANLENAVRNNAGAAGVATPELIKFSEQMQNVTAFSDEAVQGVQALLLRVKQIGDPGTFNRATKAILDVSTALGVDTVSASRAVGRALADPARGLQALTRMGVVFTAGQKEVIKSLVESGQRTEAQALILKSLEDRFSGAAEAYRNTLGGALEALKNQAGELLEQRDGLPGVTASINDLSETLKDPGVKAGLDALLGGIITLAAKAVEWVGRLSRGFTMLFDIDVGDGLANINRDIERLEKSIERAKGWGSLWGLTGDANLQALEQQRAALIALREEFVQSGSLSEDAMNRWKAAVGALAPATDEAEDEAEDLGKTAKVTQASLADLVEAARAEVETFGLGKVATLEYEIAHRRLKGEFKETGAAAAALVASLLEYTALQEELAQGEANFQKAVELANEDRARAAELTRQVLTPHEEFLAVMEELNRLHQTMGENGAPLLGDEAFYRNVAAATESLNEALKKNAEAINVFEEEASRATQRVVADFLRDWEGGLRGFLASWGEALREMAIQALSARISESLFGAGGVGSGGGLFGTLFNFIGGALGPATAAVGGGAYVPGPGGVGPVLPRDSGGRGYPGQAYAIGVGAQPEVYVPDRPGTFYPQGEGLGRQVVVNVNVAAPTGSVSRQTAAQVGAAAARGVAQADRRNN